jgi:hypothetical protein
MSEPTVDLLIKIDKITKIIAANGGDVPEMKKFSLTDGVANKDARKYYAMLRTNYSDSFYQVIDSKTVITSHTVGSSKKGKLSR